MDNIKQVVKDVRFLIATDCCDKTIQSRIENFINEREQALRIHDVVGRSEQLVCVHPYSEVYQSETECYCDKCGKDLTEAN
jgi:hypothetical protein